ncbi:DUF5753 domain-containing protein [Amycolatopsis cihanbeyliensis]|uniref:DUF5753 domain-containing protein n=1 Tax=Amycolatopsis cihanbeyliensis TaxID=1128664 RepID=UPI001FE49573|nr:DUF5753 domain-containing protein [Amycolatopsis cihanbeyliensis]
MITSDVEPYIALYDRACEKGWWHQYGHDDRGFVSIEAEASVVRTYQLGFVPGILQTETYMRNTFASAKKPLKGEKLENEVAVRLRRQRRLTEDPVLTVHAVIDETALHRPICDREQLERIIERSALPNVTVQVIPHASGPHGGLYSNFIVVSFPDREEPDLMYLDYGFGAVQIEKGNEVSAARLMFDHLADLALDEQDSIALVRRLVVKP